LQLLQDYNCWKSLLTEMKSKTYQRRDKDLLENKNTFEDKIDLGLGSTIIVNEVWVKNKRQLTEEKEEERERDRTQLSMQMFPFGHCPEGSGDVSSVCFVHERKKLLKKKTNEDGCDELDDVKTDDGSRKGGGKRLAISMVEEAWLSEKEEVSSKDKECFRRREIMFSLKRNNVFVEEKECFVEEKECFSSKRKNVSSKRKNVFVEEKRMFSLKRKNVLSKRKGERLTYVVKRLE
nr:hypothetical protein [Tanacetum cinerariifolium]